MVELTGNVLKGKLTFKKDEKTKIIEKVGLLKQNKFI